MPRGKKRLKLFGKIIPEEYENRYSLIKQNYESYIAPFTKGSTLGFTNHGSNHVTRVMEYIESIFIEHSEKKSELNPVEAFVLSTSVILHDIGMNVNKQGSGNPIEDFTHTRDLHSDLSEELIEKLFQDLIDPESNILTDIIKNIVKAHRSQSRFDINNLPETVYYTNKESIRVRYLAALLRIADELDIDFRRAPELSYRSLGKLGEVSKSHWVSSQNIQSIRMMKGGKINITLKDDTSKENLIHSYGKIRKITEELDYLIPVFAGQGTSTSMILINETLSIKRIEEILSRIEGFPDNFIHGILLLILKKEIQIDKFLLLPRMTLSYRGINWEFTYHNHHSKEDLILEKINKLETNKGLIIVSKYLDSQRQFKDRNVIILEESLSIAEIYKKILRG